MPTPRGATRTRRSVLARVGRDPVRGCDPSGQRHPHRGHRGHHQVDREGGGRDLFPTGQGNVIGNPILPVIKLTANPRTARTMAEHIDYDCSGLLQRQKNLDQTGNELLEVMLRTCNGRLTAAEALGHREFVMTRLYESA